MNWPGVAGYVCARPGLLRTRAPAVAVVGVDSVPACGLLSRGLQMSR
jgi:hypothetical protein